MTAPNQPKDDDAVLPTGTALGTWRVVRLLGSGGMGRVYLAEHAAIGRRVAIKVLRPSLARSPDLVERFFAEAHAVNRVRHPGIVEVTDCFVDGATPCLVMEFLEGRTLAEEMNAARMAPGRVAAIGADVALALEAAHRAGVIHRDLKPDNLFLLGSDDTVKVLDFGVAKLMEPMPSSTIHTVAGSIMGTPDYMAPEQLAGKVVDSRADIYALGASLYHACTGRPPFQANSFGDLVVMHMTQPPIPPTQFAPLTPAFEQVLLAMLEKDPARRPQTMGDVALLLRAAQKIGSAVVALHESIIAAPIVRVAARAPTSAFASHDDATGDALAIAAGRATPAWTASSPGTLVLGSADAPEIVDALAVTSARAPRGVDAQDLALSRWLAARPEAGTPATRAPMPQPPTRREAAETTPWTWAAVAGFLLVGLGGGALALRADELRAAEPSAGEARAVVAKGRGIL